MRHCTDLTRTKTRTELSGALIWGREDLRDTQEGHDKALGQRSEQAVATAVAVQAESVADATALGEFEPAAVGDDVRTAPLADMDEPFHGLPFTGPSDESGGGDSRAQDAVSIDWLADLPPLILIVTDYASSISAPKPHGNVVLLDPDTDTDLPGPPCGAGADSAVRPLDGLTNCQRQHPSGAVPPRTGGVRMDPFRVSNVWTIHPRLCPNS